MYACLDFKQSLGEYQFRLWRELRWIGGEQRGPYPIFAVLLNLTGTPQASEWGAFEASLDQAGLLLRIHLVTLSLENATVVLDQIAQGAVGLAVLPWVPLMSGGGLADTIGRWKHLAEGEPDGRRRSDFAGLALVFAELAGCHAAWRVALEGWNIMESEIVKAWQAQALKQGKELGRVEEGQRNLRLVLETRFGRLPKELEQRITSLDNLRTIERCLRQAATIESLDELRLPQK